MENKKQKHYQVVAAVITDNNRILCLQKGKTRYAYTSYKYEFPGGKIEEGETPQQALKRELEEEMDFHAEIGTQLSCVEHSYPDFRITLRAYLCPTSHKDFHLKEHIAFRWTEVDQLSSLDWAEADKAVVEAVIRHFSGKRTAPFPSPEQQSFKPVPPKAS